MQMTVKKIVKEYLIKNEYDGLYCDGCGCELDDLFPCYELMQDCQPEYKIFITKDNVKDYDNEYLKIDDWVISVKKFDNKEQNNAKI